MAALLRVELCCAPEQCGDGYGQEQIEGEPLQAKQVQRPADEQVGNDCKRRKYKAKEQGLATQRGHAAFASKAEKKQGRESQYCRRDCPGMCVDHVSMLEHLPGGDRLPSF